MKKFKTFKFQRKIIGLMSRVIGETFLTNIISRNYRNRIMKYLDFRYGNRLVKYIQDSNELTKAREVNIIWIFWWQTIEVAPEIVKACVNRTILVNQTYEVKVITKENFKEFIKVPDFILQRFYKGELPIQKLANIFRLYLLKEYGGFWVDATIYFVKEFNVPNNKDGLILYKRSAAEANLVRTGRYSTFFMGTTYEKDPIFEYVYQAHLLYFEENVEVIDYFLFDYIFELAYQYNVGQIKNRVSKMNEISWDIFEFMRSANNIISEPDNKRLFGDNIIWYKMSHKPKMKSHQNNNQTYWGKIISEVRSDSGR